MGNGQEDVRYCKVCKNTGSDPPCILCGRTHASNPIPTFIKIPSKFLELLKNYKLEVKVRNQPNRRLKDFQYQAIDLWTDLPRTSEMITLSYYDSLRQRLKVNGDALDAVGAALGAIARNPGENDGDYRYRIWSAQSPPPGIDVNAPIDPTAAQIAVDHARVAEAAETALLDQLGALVGLHRVLPYVGFRPETNWSLRQRIYKVIENIDALPEPASAWPEEFKTRFITHKALREKKARINEANTQWQTVKADPEW